MPGIFAALLQRAAHGQVPELQERPALTMPAPASGGPAVRPLDPHLVGLLGGLTDTLSTYRFLQNGDREDNPVAAGFAKHPAAMAALGVGATLGKYGLAKLLGRKFPTLSQVLDAEIGALQTGYGASNLMDDPVASRAAYAQALQAELQRSVRTQQGR
jgi:hypothetical protein